MPALRRVLRKIDDYPSFLESTWQDHLAIKPPNAPTVISTFAGCGGSSLGYSMAGFRELLAVEWDKNAADTFKLNFPEVPLYFGDIADLSAEKCLQMVGLKAGELDVFDGSPPCQGFSTSGKRQLDDNRNKLFLEYVRLIRGLKPKVFVMENVSGMVKGKMKLIFSEILTELKASGYKVSAKLLNAMYFGVPHSRERMIFIGIRDDLKIAPSHPLAVTAGITPLIAWKGVAADDDPRLITKEWLKEALRFIKNGTYNNHRPLFKKIKNSTGGAMGLPVLAWDKVSCTIVRSEISTCGCVHPSKERYISISEAKRIGAFPDKFVLIGDRKDKIARIGNSVPPLFMREIAKHIRTEILDKIGSD